jgi:hypothetical protein
MRVVLLGTMGGSPFAGPAWQVLHYLEGFQRVGCEVTYLEDTGTWAYDPEANTVTSASASALRQIDRVMGWLGSADAWAYVSADGERLGPAAARVDELLARADVLVNLTGGTVLREAHMRVPVRIYLETDPVLPQIEVAGGRQFTIDLLSAHTHHFTYGENLGEADCEVPVERFSWQPTRPPVVIDWWKTQNGNGNGRYTTVANWKQTEKDIRWRGETYYWSKDREFEKVIRLPHRTGVALELALACGDQAAIEHLSSHGWRVADALPLTSELERYRSYVVASRAEFTVAKDQNVRLRSGWFSDRSASYLAAGKPVITQDTGFGNVLPTGRGLFAFRTEDDAVGAIEQIESDYRAHSTAAAEIAREYFAAERVVERLLEDAGLLR